MPRPLPRHCYREKVFRKDSDFYLYVRVGHGPRIRIKAVFDTAEFWKRIRSRYRRQDSTTQGRPYGRLAGMADRTIPRGQRLDINVNGNAAATREYI
jgi:hypothetical protein